MNRVVHFEINVDDPERAIKFYTQVFGWTVNKWENPGLDYWLVMTGDEKEPGINGGIGKRMHPSATTINIIDVKSIDESIEKVKASGGDVVMPKTTVPSVGYLAYCKDTEGNVFGMMQMDPNAK